MSVAFIQSTAGIQLYTMPGCCILSALRANVTLSEDVADTVNARSPPISLASIKSWPCFGNDLTQSALKSASSQITLPYS